MVTPISPKDIVVILVKQDEIPAARAAYATLIDAAAKQKARMVYFDMYFSSERDQKTDALLKTAVITAGRHRLPIIAAEYNEGENIFPFTSVGHAIAVTEEGLVDRITGVKGNPDRFPEFQRVNEKQLEALPIVGLKLIYGDFDSEICLEWEQIQDGVKTNNFPYKDIKEEDLSVYSLNDVLQGRLEGQLAGKIVMIGGEYAIDSARNDRNQRVPGLYDHASALIFYSQQVSRCKAKPAKNK